MDVTHINVGDYFITSAIPVERAFRYGILCKAKEDLKVVFERFTTKEEFALFVKDGQVDTGNWIKTRLNGHSEVDSVVLLLDKRNDDAEFIRRQIESGTKDMIKKEESLRETLKDIIER